MHLPWKLASVSWLESHTASPDQSLQSECRLSWEKPFFAAVCHDTFEHSSERKTLGVESFNQVSSGCITHHNIQA